MPPAFPALPLSQGDTRLFLPPRLQTLGIVAEALFFLRELGTRALFKDWFVVRLVLSSPTIGGISGTFSFCCKHAAKQFPMLTIFKQRFYRR